jgi:hypothetical protein
MKLRESSPFWLKINNCVGDEAKKIPFAIMTMNSQMVDNNCNKTEMKIYMNGIK